MFRRVLQGLLASLLVVSLTGCVMEFDNAGSIVSGVTEEYKETVQLAGEYQKDEPLKLELDMKMAKADIGSTGDKLADVKFVYSTEALKPQFKADLKGISIRNKIDKVGFSKPVNKWDASITNQLPLEVELNSDASDVKLDMGGMIINKLNSQLNASSAKLYFDEPNKGSVDKLRISANASDVALYNGGNIGFEVLAVDANASKILMELSGENRQESEVRIDADASTLRLKLPEDTGVRIVIDKYELSSVRIDNDRLLSRSEKEYVTRDYNKAEKTIKIYVDMNVTTLNVE